MMLIKILLLIINILFNIIFLFRRIRIFIKIFLQIIIAQIYQKKLRKVAKMPFKTQKLFFYFVSKHFATICTFFNSFYIWAISFCRIKTNEPWFIGYSLFEISESEIEVKLNWKKKTKFSFWTNEISRNLWKLNWKKKQNFRFEQMEFLLWFLFVFYGAHLW